jgi:chorismate--pyruvate lyase
MIEQTSPILPPISLVPWLEATDSITLMAKTGCQTVKVHLLKTGWVYPSESQTPEYCREILMICDDSPWWYAKTRIPEKTFNKRKQIFLDLGEKSLGCLLFSDKGITRQSLHYYSTNNSEATFQLAKKHVPLKNELLWARESIFQISGEPLFLLEVFLPKMLETVC